MKRSGLLMLCLFALMVPLNTLAQQARTISFDNNWRFTKDSVINAEQQNYNDSEWRTVTLPHDWSIEDLPNQTPDTIAGPFSRNSIGKAATGFTVGGTGWYRKKFISEKNFENHLVTILFDGVYMNSDVWLNGHHLGNHPYGYTPFYYDLTPYLNPAGQQNILSVKVQNEGKTSRWYSGSGIYRHVWLTVTEPVHVPVWGVYITTPEVSTTKAIVQVKTSVNNTQKLNGNVNMITTILSPSGKSVGKEQHSLSLDTDTSKTDEQSITLTNPVLWSVEAPALYKAVTEIKEGNKLIDRVETSFGIRSIVFSAQNGFLLNGKRLILKGGCIHNDNGSLGSATIDRAEERKIELLKKVGYNAIRCSHNPPSKQLLDACDRLGMLVIDEAFDMWHNAKNPQDYHLYFKDWWQKDLDAMVLRDRNHPSVIMWSIGNEIYEAPDSIGHELSKQLADEVRRLDNTRAVTEAIVFLPPYTKKPWQDYEPNLANLDVDGYNYFLESKDIYFQRDSATLHRFDTEHAKHPNKTYIVTEYLPGAALDNWEKSVTVPSMLGSFKWTAIDYIGEAGIGKSLFFPKDKKLPTGMMGIGQFYKNAWPVFNAYCGDLDLIGNRKAASYFQSVIWRNSTIEMLVHQPVADNMKEAIATWGFPEELKSWSWPGQKGKKVQVHVYTRSKQVKLELNGKIIGQQTIPDSSITATFDVNYQPGILIAKSYDDRKETGADTLMTTGKSLAIRLHADRSNIKSNPNDLSYINVEVVDEKGKVIPYVDDLLIKYQVEGVGEIAGVGNVNPADASSFQQPQKKVFQGKGLVILRPKGNAGKIVLKAEATGLREAQIIINTQ